MNPRVPPKMAPSSTKPANRAPRPRTRSGPTCAGRVIPTATLGAWVGDRLVTLADLEDTTLGGRQPPGGESILVRGRAADVVFEAEFFTGEAGATPQASVALTIYPDRVLPTVRGVRFF